MRTQCRRETLTSTRHTKYKSRPVAAFVFGGVEEDRTPDLRIANAALSQLSYHP